MKRLFLFFVIVSFISTSSAVAQEWGYGFKTGLNFSQIVGDAESADGNSLESFGTRTGFHVGGGVVAKITDFFGLKAGLVYTQKGTAYKYSGKSFKTFTASTDETIFTTGTRNVALDITNSYLTIPIMAYVKILDRRLELFGGVELGFLVRSRGEGELRYEGVTPTGSVLNEYTQILVYDYFKDEPGQAADEAGLDPIIFILDGKSVILDKEVGAYYERTEKDGSYYNIFDVGLVAGTNYYINRGLYLGFTFTYGLLDASNNDFDFSKLTSENGTLVPRNDIDHNINYQISIGFGF
ncbi:MAG: outer membrane beta-barrel protein [Saprospiraceae bacterium]